MATFKELREIGSKVRGKLLENPETEEWFYSIYDNISEQDSFPSDTFDYIINYLHSINNEESNKLVDHILEIVQEDDADNILNQIFTIEEGGEDFEEEEKEEILKFEEEEEEEKETHQDSNDPHAFFDSRINSLKSILCVSYDLAYLLLKKFEWDYNLIVNSWVQNNMEPLKKLHIKFGGPLFSSTKSELTSKISGNGTCPICYDEADLYQMYCGHSMCKECLTSEITFQIENGKLPICRSNNEKGSACQSEIIPSDIKQFIKDSTLLRRYNQLRLESEIETCPDVKECPNCHILISTANDLGCHTGQCPQCHFTTCLKCLYNGSHAPLFNCNHVNDFTIVVKNKMAMLDQAQKLWYIREERLKDYRKTHQNEFKRYFDQLISNCTKNFTDLERKEIARIKEKDADISEKEKILNSLFKNKNSKTPSSNVDKEIEELQKEINKIRDLKALFQKENRVNKQDRDHYLRRLNKLKQFFIWSITEERHKFQYGITKFQNKLNRLVSQKLSKPIDLTIDNSDNSSKVTKECPRCHVTIFKQGGCNYVQCLKCGYQFCWICNQSWVPPHGDHFFCPNYSLSQGKLTTHVINGIDYDDPKDKTFYPMPLDPDKMTEFVKYNNLYMEYKKNKDKVEKLREDFLKDGKDEYMKYRLKKCLRKENSETVANELAEKIITDILFAQNTIAWGYAELFYIVKEISYNLFEYRISLLEKLVDDFLKLLSSFDLNQPTSFFNHEIELINKEVSNLFISAETQI